MPGASAMSDQMSRALGIACIICAVKLFWTFVFCVSMTGDCPVTVTDSCSVASWSCTFTSAAKPTPTWIPSLMTFVNPDSW